jgi:DNA-binding IscR family transcriptional regulator
MSAQPDDVLEITLQLGKDIIQFLSSKHTENATISLSEVMKLYHCPQDRALRVIANLVEDRVIESVGGGVYRVII